jgi:HSP20 family protein
MDWKSIAPWNWFRKEQERDVPPTLPATRTEDPFTALHREMDRAFDDVFRRFGVGALRGPSWPSLPSLDEATSLLRPSLDISESRKAYTLKVEVPGVEKGDVTLQIEDDTLLIRGEKKQEKEESDENYHCVERSYGGFERMISLPEDVDPERIDAKFKHGVLKVTIPKRAVTEKQGRTIDIQHE